MESSITPTNHSWHPLAQVWAGLRSSEPDSLQTALGQLIDLLLLGTARTRPIEPLLAALLHEGPIPLPDFQPLESHLDRIPRAELLLVSVDAGRLRLRLRFPMIPRPPLRTRLFSLMLPPVLMTPLVFIDVVPPPPRITEFAEVFATVALDDLLGERPFAIPLDPSSYDEHYEDFASRADRIWWDEHARGRAFLADHLHALARRPPELRAAVLDALLGSLVRVLASDSGPSPARAVQATRLRLALGSWAGGGDPELDELWVGQLLTTALLLGLDDPQERALAAELVGSLGSSPLALAAAVTASLAPPRPVRARA